MNRKVYLINQGSTTYEELQYIEKKLRKEGTPVAPYRNKMMAIRNQDNKLNMNGIFEIREAKKNHKLMNIYEDDAVFYSILSKSSIESGLVFLNSLKDSSLHILPYKSRNQRISSANSLEEFKQSFGSSPNNVYWNISNNIINKRANVKLHWNKVEYKDLTTDFMKLKNFIEQESMVNEGPIFLFLDEGTIIRFLRSIKTNGFRYQSKLKIEHGSCIELTIKKSNSMVNINSFEKIYPTKFNYDPLQQIEGVYYFTYKGKKYSINGEMDLVKPFKGIYNAENNKKNNKKNHNKNMDSFESVFNFLKKN